MVLSAYNLVDFIRDQPDIAALIDTINWFSAVSAAKVNLGKSEALNM